MDDAQVLPLVLESGDITVKLDDTQRIVSGTPLNDKLFAFLKKYQQLQNQQMELVHKHDQAIMDGSDMNVVVQKLNEEAMKLADQEDKLVTTFVTDNFDNVLGPGVFFMLTVQEEYPMLTPWIEDIMSKATDTFKNDPYVKDFYQKAQENQQIMNGTRDAEMAAPSVQAPQIDPNAAPAPTANDLAKPTIPEKELGQENAMGK